MAPTPTADDDPVSTSEALPRNLTELLTHSAERYGARAAFTCGDQAITFGELDHLVAAGAAGLGDLGVGPGDKVALLLPNCPQFVIGYLAALRLGAVVVPINCMLSVPEVAFIIENSGAETLITVDLLAPVGAGVQAAVPGLKRLVVSGANRPEGAVAFEGLLAATPGAAPGREAAPSDLATIIYTSGTTGRPKGAMLSHRNLIFDADSSRQVIRIDHDDVFLGALPLFHTFGATICMILPLLAGSHSVLIPKFGALSALTAIEQHRTTVFPGVPAMFGVMLKVKADRKFDLSSLRLGMSGGAPIMNEVLTGFEARYGVTMLEGYGATETSPVVSFNPLGGRHKLGSVGLPIPGVEVTIQGEDDRPLPAGEVGEVCVRGDNVMMGYWREPEATAAAIREGWLHTGDMGRMDEEGYLYIVGRAKDLIIVGGLNVYPREIEDVVTALEEVAEAAVVGVADAVAGERPRLFVILKEGAALGEQEIITHCREHLASFKVPKEVTFRDDFPRTATGKIVKRDMLTAGDG